MLKYLRKQSQNKALRKAEFSKLFVFVSFGIVRFPKFGNFLEISGLFKLAYKFLFLRQKQGFPNIPNLRYLQNLFYSKLSKNYKKLCSNRISEIAKNLFRLEFRLEHSSSSSECRALSQNRKNCFKFKKNGSCCIYLSTGGPRYPR
jgi:hypothetical protein